MQWYYEQNREQRGPVAASELKSLYNAGEINSSNLVWCSDLQDWASYGSVFGPTDVRAALRPAAVTSGTGGNTPNAALRAQARRALKGSWGMAALTVFLWQVVQGAAGMVPLVGPLAQLAIGGAMLLGLYGFFMRLNRGASADVAVLFQGFTQFWPAMGIYVLTGLLVFLLALAAAIPGIAWIGYLLEQSALPEEHPLFGVAVLIAVIPFILVSIFMWLRYAMVYFIARDQPGLGVRATIAGSVQMMQGKKWKFLCLGLSFMAWHLLGMCALVVGLFWSCAYMFAAFAAFYDDLKEA
ncbi:MAG: DUF975 family protein [Opitutales bacterium]